MHIQSIIVFLIVLAAVVYIAANFIRKHRPTKHVGECKQECGCGR
ncbi:MAG: FeoB-associated Cys-rich membrane protein [Blastocatellia bacterium]|nr:FeoB-associated Cys-rich membrane protein [Chloracidobacterium sp.]MBL8183599.1 FeoB-associated Cys-rich membrane protein [Blastocatellia bacterium]